MWSQIWDLVNASDIPKRMHNILDGIMNASCPVEIEVNVFVWLSKVPSCHLDVRSLYNPIMKHR
jgi:hypothetical protein